MTAAGENVMAVDQNVSAVEALLTLRTAILTKMFERLKLKSERNLPGHSGGDGDRHDE